jgi:hypothetical protein
MHMLGRTLCPVRLVRQRPFDLRFLICRQYISDGYRSAFTDHDYGARSAVPYRTRRTRAQRQVFTPSRSLQLAESHAVDLGSNNARSGETICILELSGYTMAPHSHLWLAGKRQRDIPAFSTTPQALPSPWREDDLRFREHEQLICFERD